MKVPYQMVAAMEPIKRHAQMAVATLHYKYPRLQDVPVDNTKTLTLACYGPSLEETWQDIQHPIMSMSGATRFLADKGIIADYHIDMDPRAHKIQHLTPPVDGVHYLMATVCPLETWKILEGQRVTLWHTYSGKDTYDWVAANDPGQHVVRGGSTIGLTAFHLGGLLGYRHFEVHGMDGCFRDQYRKSRHAGPHYGHSQSKDGITWKAGGKTYHTSKIMSNAVSETIQTLKGFPIFAVFHGEGLTQALIAESNLPNACVASDTEKAAKVRGLSARSVDLNLFAWNHDVLHEIRATPVDTWVEDWKRIDTECETTRSLANFNTGSIGFETWILLRAISRAHAPKVTVEVGTFIGKSTRAFMSEKIYTCDKDNDCLRGDERITTYPKKGSTEMLTDLLAKGVKADMFFFDGRIQPPDFAMILRMSHPKTIYVFDDHDKGAKGVINADYLEPLLKGYVRFKIKPRRDPMMTLAALVPKHLVKQ